MRSSLTLDRGNRRRGMRWGTAAVMLVAVTLAACAGHGARTAQSLSTAQEFATALQKAKYGCAQTFSSPRQSSDPPALVSRSTCTLSQQTYTPSTKELQRMARLGQTPPSNDDAVSGLVALFLYRNGSAAATAAKQFVSYSCKGSYHPPVISYFRGPNWFVTTQGPDPDVLAALDTVFGSGTVTEKC